MHLRAILPAILAGALLLAFGTAPADATSESQNCRDRLDRRDISFMPGPERRGVANPVRVKLPLHGVAYIAEGQANPDSTLFMDCRLAIALDRMGATLRHRGIRTVEHLGIYNYRCIAGTDPCVLSEHAHATAIDLHEFRAATGETYNVEDHWFIDPGEQPTCSAQTVGKKDSFLHDLVCVWDARNLFNIILTPNYNAAHRNHFHVDLTPGRDYIR